MEKVFRSAWFWFGLLIGCYAISLFWFGPLLFGYVFMAAPSGFFHLLGFSDFENGFGVVDSLMMFPSHLPKTLMMLFAHLAFWSVFIYLVCRRKNMPRISLFRFGWGLVIFLVLNFAGCATMSYHP